MEGTTLNQKFGYLFGAVYVLVGLVGFAVTSGVAFAASNSGKNLIIFELNPLHNVAHVLVGLLLIGGAAAGFRASRGVNLLVGTVYAFLGIAGFFVLNSSANILSVNVADNFLHLGTAAIAFAVAMKESDVTRATA